MRLRVTAVYGEDEVSFPMNVGDGRKNFKWLGKYAVLPIYPAFREREVDSFTAIYVLLRIFALQG
jgi:hypothetical protein